MKSKSSDNASKTPVKGVHKLVADQNIREFLTAMVEFDESRGKERKLHLATSLIKMMVVSDVGGAANAMCVLVVQPVRLEFIIS